MSRIGSIVRLLYGDDVKPPSRKYMRFRRRLAYLNELFHRQPTLVWVVRIVVLVLALIIAAEGVFQYNRLQTWVTKVDARRADVDRELKRRENLIPGVVGLAGRYAKYELDMFQYVSDSRTLLQTLKSAQSTGLDVGGMLENAVSKLMALAEAYPDLKATQPVQDLIDKLAVTEDRIADAKKDYNAACEQFNQYRTTFPGNVFALAYGFKPSAYIGLDEDVDLPRVWLDISSQLSVVPEISVDSNAPILNTTTAPEGEAANDTQNSTQ
ncbi:MAG: LemA family protein [Phycisphaeraceae bacterium]|nr:LemA family protein [Phycisphaeraceae bacterium]